VCVVRAAGGSVILQFTGKKSYRRTVTETALHEKALSERALRVCVTAVNESSSSVYITSSTGVLLVSHRVVSAVVERISATGEKNIQRFFHHEDVLVAAATLLLLLLQPAATYYITTVLLLLLLLLSPLAPESLQLTAALCCTIPMCYYTLESFWQNVLSSAVLKSKSVLCCNIIFTHLLNVTVLVPLCIVARCWVLADVCCDLLA
jgi:hypothetical protein